MRYWEKFCRQIQCDAKLWLLLMLVLSCYRVAMLIHFRSRMLEDSTTADVMMSLLIGIRFDLVACTYWMLPCIVISVICGFFDFERSAARLRWCTAVLFFLVTPLIGATSIEFFREFGDGFNQFLFNVWYDNKPALLSTAWQDYHLLAHLIISAMVLLLVYSLWRKFFQGPFLSTETVLRYTPGYLSRFAMAFALIALVVCAMRGSMGRKPTGQGIAVRSGDVLLNKASINPYMSLLYAARVQLEIAGEGGLKVYLPDENVTAAVRQLFPEAPADKDLDRILTRMASGPRNDPPKHIFLLGMESYDAWPLLEKYQCLGLTSELRGLAAEGLHVKAFLPSDEYSMRFLNTVITGLPYAGIQINWQRAAEKPFASSLPETMRKLGYRTRFFCGAPLDWQNCQYFCKSQGFDEVYGSLDIMNGTKSNIPLNLWAAPDELTWKFVASKIKDDEPSFTIVFSSSYHVPYDIDLEKAGCPLKSVPPELASEWEVPREQHLHKLGHLWYADRELGKFVRKMDGRLTRPLFAITGDHFSRNFINSHPTPYERAAVPFVLYGKQVLKGIELPWNVAGGHVDIPATLVELAAPRGFVYHAFGKNLLAPSEQFFGYGAAGRIIGNDFIALADKPDVLYPIPGQPLPPMIPDVPGLQSLASAARGASWWRAKHGSELPGVLPAAEVTQGAIDVAARPGSTFR